MKKFIAPIIVGILMVSYFLFVLLVMLMDGIQPNPIGIITVTIFTVPIIIAIIYLVIERIKEIKEEEKDEISKY